MSENPVNSRSGDQISPEGPVINWDRIIHKNVRTADDQGMGKVIAVPNNEDTIIISSQSADDFYKVPRSMVTGFNGAEVQLGVTTDSMTTFHVEDASAYEAYPSDVITEEERRATTEQPREARRRGEETTIPVVEERLKVAKRMKTEEARITKEPVTETKNVEVPVTKERLVVERRSADLDTAGKPVESEQEIKVPLQKEEMQVSKEPYVKEEVVVRKKPVTETRTVSDTTATERVNVGNTRKSRQKKRGR